MNCSGWTRVRQFGSPTWSRVILFCSIVFLLAACIIVLRIESNSSRRIYVISIQFLIWSLFVYLYFLPSTLISTSATLHTFFHIMPAVATAKASIAMPRPHVCPPSNATHPSSRWESMYIYSFILKFTKIRIKVEGFECLLECAILLACSCLTFITFAALRTHCCHGSQTLSLLKSFDNSSSTYVLQRVISSASFLPCFRVPVRCLILAFRGQARTNDGDIGVHCAGSHEATRKNHIL